MLVAFFAGIVLNGILRLLLRAMGNPAELHLAYNVVFAVPFLETIAPALIPISIAFSIFKYRLWDIDLVINRSLVYGLVTVGLIASFGLVAWGLQAALIALLGLKSTWIPLLVSVALTAFLFNPLYQNAQRIVDRRLYGFRFLLDDLKRPTPMPEIKNPGMLTGYTLGGYHVLGLLGRGGMGEVYQGEGQGKQAAIKVLPIDLSADKLFRERLQCEASALATLEHPNIVQFYGSGEERNYLFLIMEFIAGQDLRARLRQQGAFSFEELIPIIKNMASALDHIHAKGIVHRDLKPSNVMLRSSDSQPVLMDFGIAHVQKSHSALTASGIIGTVDYMAPEQILTSSSVDYRADIYALGVMLYEMLTGERPFQGNTGQVLFGHLQQPPPDPKLLLPNLPAHVSKVIQRALAKSPNDRYHSAHDLAKAFAG
jgi:predicted Ser/Thr protein kinase